MITFLASTRGRAFRIAAGLLMVFSGVWFGTPIGAVVAVVGILPFATGVLDVCLLGPIFREPFLGSDIRRRHAAV